MHSQAEHKLIIATVGGIFGFASFEPRFMGDLSYAHGESQLPPSFGERPDKCVARADVLRVIADPSRLFGGHGSARRGLTAPEPTLCGERLNAQHPRTAAIYYYFKKIF